MKISKSVDSYIAVYADNNPFWTINLTNGEHIYQDDDRPGLEIASAWKRAKIYIYENSLEIDNVTFRFAGYQYTVYDSKKDDTYDGCYFSRGKVGLLSDANSRTIDVYVAGKVYGHQMSVVKFEVPFLREYENYERLVDDRNRPSIILDRNKRV
jgi:hypothetical protein